jgi:steroid delta-isomerase-like uncharacterized protein
MSDHHRRLIASWFEGVWNQGRPEIIDEMLAADTVLHDGDVDSHGPGGFKRFYDRMQSAFSNIHVTLHQVISEGDSSCVRWSATMRHTGAGLGPPATGKELHTTGITLIRSRDGRFAEAWQNWDMLGLIQQMTGASGESGVYVAGH